jgi:hypothetical protein
MPEPVMPEPAPLEEPAMPEPAPLEEPEPMPEPKLPFESVSIDDGKCPPPPECICPEQPISRDPPIYHSSHDSIKRKHSSVIEMSDTPMAMDSMAMDEEMEPPKKKRSVRKNRKLSRTFSDRKKPNKKKKKKATKRKSSTQKLREQVKSLQKKLKEKTKRKKRRSTKKKSTKKKKKKKASITKKVMSVFTD